ncbi:MAG: hypothetical protein ABI175_15395 [Polyangiales bacterium]
MALEQLTWDALRFPAAGMRPATPVVPATADQIRERAKHVVSKPETMNYRTMMPEVGGMFDPKLFGPGTVIDGPAIDPDAVVKPRKTWFGRIPLTVPIVHPLFVEHVRPQLGEQLGVGAAAISDAGMSLARGRAIVALLEAHAELAPLVMTELPMAPPELRPLHRTEDDRWMTGGLNLWYQRVINRNRQLARSLETPDTDPLVLDSQFASLHETIRRLFENDESTDAELDADGKALPSLRTLCGGTLGLYRALRETHPADGPQPGRCHVSRLVMFALGFAVSG